ncbi:hypothetical protein [Natronolimnohabitans innermongolicus]|uniref:DUF308 domain-containing protein n=1 Tax=Natronolimnohabitans innermongolicus JCM 12255 TaxID=1227499 RepID=L9XMM3_9EURY|nr:hypothetical protein [Natronolimnohabitans innermongolicus]ELY61913.1 hypothetical protein C493_01495 [Natronolimnohabitans innermongolicus JCM 12255]
MTDNVDRTDESTTDGEPDVDALRTDLEQIKSAMAIEDRYPGQRRLWLVHGIIVGFAGVLTNVMFVYPWPEFVYILVWTAVFVLIGYTQWQTSVRTATTVDDPEPKPSWTVVFGTLVAGLFVLTAIVDPIFADVESVLQGAFFFSVAFTVLGMGYLLAGTILHAYRIRASDRYPFYVNGIWILAFAFVMPFVEWLQYVGYALFGILFFLHGAVTYYLLTYRLSG